MKEADGCRLMSFCRVVVAAVALELDLDSPLSGDVGWSKFWLRGERAEGRGRPAVWEGE
jgi:hypothetical protein